MRYYGEEQQQYAMVFAVHHACSSQCQNQYSRPFQPLLLYVITQKIEVQYGEKQEGTIGSNYKSKNMKNHKAKIQPTEQPRVFGVRLHDFPQQIQRHGIGNDADHAGTKLRLG